MKKGKDMYNHLRPIPDIVVTSLICFELLFLDYLQK